MPQSKKRTHHEMEALSYTAPTPTLPGSASPILKTDEDDAFPLSIWPAATPGELEPGLHGQYAQLGCQEYDCGAETTGGFDGLSGYASLHGRTRLLPA